MLERAEHENLDGAVVETEKGDPPSINGKIAAVWFHFADISSLEMSFLSH